MSPLSESKVQPQLGQTAGGHRGHSPARHGGGDGGEAGKGFSAQELRGWRSRRSLSAAGRTPAGHHQGDGPGGKLWPAGRRATVPIGSQLLYYLCGR